MTLKPPFGWKLRLIFGLSEWLTRAGLMPSADAMTRWPVARRKAIKPAGWMTYPPPPTVRTAREAITTAAGPLDLKWFRTTEAEPPSILFIHGGGWVTGGVDSLDYLCANLCDRLGVGVVAVDYRLAPEHPFPAGLADCYAALTWVAARATGPVIVVGDSAGGNLAGALCLLAQQRQGPAIAQQVLIYPGLDVTLESPSAAERHPGPSRAELEMVVRHYLGGHDPRDPLVSPILAPSHRGLPPAFIVTAQWDLLRDDGPRYAERLRAAGVAVDHVNYRNMAHGFLSMPKVWPDAPQALADIVAAIRPHLPGPAVSHGPGRAA